MTEVTIHSIWYRSLTPDGKLWCESSNLDEVLRMSVGKNCTYQRQINELVTHPWEEWSDKIIDVDRSAE